LDYTRVLGADMPEGVWGNAFDVYYWPPDNALHKKYIEGITKMFNVEDPGCYALPVYMAIHFLNAAVTKAKTVETEAVINALEDIKIDSPFSSEKLYYRKCDHQCNYGTIWGVTKKDPRFPYLILDKIQHISASEGWESCEAIEKAREGAK
jgi:branched-chain amino acid transport system substrate-binding protein